MNKKRKIRLIWLNEWQLEEHEAWFADMARQGWRLEKLRLWFATFVESEPEDISYRIEIANKNEEIESDRIHLYEDAGWEYVTSRRFMYVFSEKEVNKATEIHTDPAMQAETIEILKKSVWRSGIAVALLTLFIITLFALQISNMSSYYMLGNHILSNIIYLVIYLPLSLNWLIGMVQISSLIKRMRYGKGLNHQKPYKRKLNINKFGSIFFAIIYISLFGLWVSWDGLISSEERYPTIPEAGLPVVSLTDVENVNLNQVTYDTNGIEREMQNHFVEKTSILFPDQYILRQQFIIPESSEQPASNYRPTIQSRKYEALTAGIAEKLVDTLREDEHSSERFTEKTGSMAFRTY